MGEARALCRAVSGASRPAQTDIEITREEDFARILQMEEEYIQQICEDLLRVKPDLVITEKGISGNGAAPPPPPSPILWHPLLGCEGAARPVTGAHDPLSDLAQHYLMRANISAVRRVRKTDNNRIAR